MSSAAKGLAGLVVALALIAGVAFWILKDDSSSNPLAAAGRSAATREAAALPAPESAQSRTEAQRAAEATPTPPPQEAEGALPAGTPTADFLAGVVVDHDGAPVANAEISFAPSSIGPRVRGGRNVRIRAALVPKETTEIPATIGRSGPDGTFRLAHVPRVDGLDLTVDHPDYVFLRKSGIVLPSKGLDLGRITVEAGGSVSGQVFGPGGAKLANAEVWLDDAPDNGNGGNGLFPFRMFGFGQTRGERKATTDEQGRFHLTGMPAGKCIVAAKSSDCPEGDSPTVELKAHEEVGNVVVNLELGDKITGIVKGPDGKPVAGAEIHANPGGQGMRGMNIKFAGRRTPFEPDTATDEQGRFEVKALKRGIFNVTVDAKGYAMKEVADVDSAATAPLEISLTTGTHLAGMVHIKDSPELAKNVKVQLTPVWGDVQPPPSYDFPDADNAATQDGAFVIQDVDPGKYRVVARGDDTTRGTSDTIEVVEGRSLENVEITVERGALVVGRVVDAATGAPVAGVEVSAETIPQDDGSGKSGSTRQFAVTAAFGGGRSGRRFVGAGARQTVARAKSDAEGKYELKGLPAGQFTIGARHPDYAALRSAPVEVKTAEAKEGIDLSLLRGGTIEGAVTGIDGKPRTGDRIDVSSTTVDGVSINALTDANGTYRVEHVPAGDGVATRAEPDTGPAGRPVFRMAFSPGGGQEDPGKPFTMKEGDLVRIDFAQQEKPWVEGVVRCVDGPVAGATVLALPGGDGGRRGFFGDQKSATTGADGSYRIADLDPGSYRISVRHPQGIVPVQQPVELKTGEPARQDFFLEGGVIEGSVTALKNHAKLEGATVTIEKVKDDANAQGGVQDTVTTTFAISLAPGGRGRRGGMQSYTFGGDPGRSQVMTDDDGHFRVPWVPAGKWKVSASHAGYLAAQSEAVELTANAKVDGVHLELAPAARLVVHMKSKGTGLPMANAPVDLSTEEGGRDFRVTDEDGAATFDSLKPGTWTVSGRKGFNNNDPVKKTVDAPADRTTEVTIDA
jgi:uncharacterized GH25 family protein